jgi:hypothetical protein
MLRLKMQTVRSERAKASGANPGALPEREPSKLFVLNEILKACEILGGHCSRFCDGQILTSLQLSTP